MRDIRIADAHEVITGVQLRSVMWCSFFMVPMPVPFPWMPQTLNDALSVLVSETKIASVPKVLDHPLCEGRQSGRIPNSKAERTWHGRI